MQRSTVVSVIVAGVVVASAVAVYSSRASWEPKFISEPASCTVSFFIKNQCATCHDPSGKGSLRQNLTPRGMDYLAKDLGCTASAKTIVGQAHPGPEGPPREERRGMVRAHFVAFNCQQCHDIDGKGKTRSNLISYGMEMHEAGKGCISCLNVIKQQAGRTDLIEVPHYAKD